MTTSGSGTTTTAYYGGLAESVNGALSYLLSDGLGSVSEAVSTTSGAVTATQLYGPYGGVRYQSGTLPTSKGFTGQRSDASTSGLDYYNARYYDPVAGQFTSADTMLAGGLNRYAYVGGNPETQTDPSGHCPWCIAGAIIGAVVGAGIAYGTQVAANVAQGGSLTDGSTWAHNIDWGSVAMGAVNGALIGLVAGATLGVGLAAAGGVMALESGTVGTAAVAGGTAAFNFLVNGVVPDTSGDGQAPTEVGAAAGTKSPNAATQVTPSATTATTD